MSLEKNNESKIHHLLNLDEEFEKLSNILNRFNPFKALGISHHEIRHSNIVAWLLNPNENHGLKEITIEPALPDDFTTTEKPEYADRKQIIITATNNTNRKEKYYD